MDQRTRNVPYVLSDLGIVIFVNKNSFLSYQIDHRPGVVLDDRVVLDRFLTLTTLYIKK